MAAFLAPIWATYGAGQAGMRPSTARTGQRADEWL